MTRLEHGEALRTGAGPFFRVHFTGIIVAYYFVGQGNVASH